MAAPRPGGTPEKVLVIGDRTETLRVLAVILTAHGYRTDIADGAVTGLAGVARCQPDGVIVELAGPAVNGAEFIARLRGLTKAPVIALSASATIYDKVAALDAGADDYVARLFDAPELLARLRAMLRRTCRASTTSKVRIGTRIVDIARRTVTGTGPQGDVALTPTEWQVLEVLICRPGRLVSTQELLTEVPGRARVPGTTYLRGHLMHLRQKLETDPAAPRHLLTEPGMGFRFRP